MVDQLPHPTRAAAIEGEDQPWQYGEGWLIEFFLQRAAQFKASLDEEIADFSRMASWRPTKRIEW